MAQNLVSQGSYDPTRKVTAMTMATAAFEVVWLVWSNAFPHYASPELKMALTPILPLAVGWFVKDSAVITVTQEIHEYEVELPNV